MAMTNEAWCSDGNILDVPADDAQHVDPVLLRRSAMDLLARREHATEELAQKLRKRFRIRSDEQGIINAVLKRLADQGLLSDERYAASLVRQCINRGLGPRRIAQELKLKGISDSLVSIMRAATIEIDWFEHAEGVYAKKYGVIPLPDARDDRQKSLHKRMRFMQYRGFAAEHFVHLANGS